MKKFVSVFILICSVTICDGALLTGRIEGLQGSQGRFYWGDSVHDLYQNWSVNDKNRSGWFYGSTRGDSNVDVYVYADLQDPTSIKDASVFPYWDSSSKTYPSPWGLAYAAWAQEGDTVFFRGTNGYYGAWYIEDIYYDLTNPTDYAALHGTWYFLDDGSYDFSVSSILGAKYSGGTGEPNNPYQIATVENLMLLGDSVDDYDKHFILTADIDLDPNLPGRRVFNQAIIAPELDELEYGFQGTPFTGIFDGNHHTISHLTIRGGAWLGLFGQLESEGEIKNLGLVNVSVTGSGFVGGLLGLNYRGNITNCYSIGTVSGNGNVGGLVGGNEGNIIKSFSASIVIGNLSVGGLTGHNVGGSIISCYSTGTVTGYEEVGGLVGLLGLSSDGNIITSYSTSTVSGNFNIGGLVGNNYHGSIDKCYSTGAIRGIQTHSVGGLVGITWGKNNVLNCYWDIQTSGQTTSSGGIGKTTVEMQTANTFLEAEWDFIDEIINGTEDIWWIDEDQDYPHLWWEQVVWFPDYVPLDPNAHGVKTFEWIYGRIGTYTSEIAGTETVSYSTGSITGIQITNHSDWGMGLIANDGIAVKFLGVEDWYFSTDSKLTSHPSEWSFDVLSNGMIIDQDVYYMVSTDQSTWTREDNKQIILITIQDVTVPTGSFNDAVILWYIDKEWCFAPLNFYGTESDLGLLLPTELEAQNHAITHMEIYGMGTGLIADGDINTATGDLEDLAVLVEHQHGDNNNDHTNDSDLLGSWSVTSMGWVGGWPIRLVGTDFSVVFEFKVDAFIVTAKDVSTLLCETTGIYHTSDDKLNLLPTGTRGNECTDDFRVPAIAEYSISGDVLTLVEVAEDPVWYELKRIN